MGDNATTRELRTQTETTLVAILQETLDAVYAEEFQAKAREHAEGASHELIHLNAGGALAHVTDVLQMVMQEVLEVLRSQWHRLLRVLLNVIMTALEDAPGRSGGSRKGKSLGDSKKNKDD